MVTGLPSSHLRQARLAVAVAFFVNGAVFANWVPRIPDVKLGLGLTPAGLGTALIGVGAGAVLGSAVAGIAVDRFGSRRITRGAALLLGASMILPAAAPSWAALLVALVVVGFLDAVMDVAMNANGVRVQQGYGRSILNGFHAVWSLGAAAGAVMGTVAVAADVGPVAHLAVSGVLLGLVGALTGAKLLRQPPRRAPSRPVPRRGLRQAPLRVVGPLGLVALFSAVMEGAPADWSAVYLTTELDGSAAVAGLGFAAFSAAMIAGRLGGDALVDRIGAARVVRLGGVLAAVSFATVALADSPALALLGFGVAGLAVSTFFPLAFSAAGSLDGVPAGSAIAVVSLVARFGFLAGPPVIGGIAHGFSLSLGLALPAAAGLVVVALAGAAAPAGRSLGDRASG